MRSRASPLPDVAGAAARRASLLARDLLRTTKKTGVRSKPNKVTPIMPLKTAVPSAWRISAPAPEAITNGKTPNMNAKEVIRIGRNRILASFHDGINQVFA